MQNEAATALTDLIGMLSADSRVQCIHAMKLPGITRIFVTVPKMQDVKENPPIPAGILDGIFDISYNAPPGLPPSFSDKVYQRKMDGI